MNLTKSPVSHFTRVQAVLVVHEAARAAVSSLAQHKQQRPGPVIQAHALPRRRILAEGPALPLNSRW